MSARAEMVISYVAMHALSRISILELRQARQSRLIARSNRSSQLLADTLNSYLCLWIHSNVQPEPITWSAHVRSARRPLNLVSIRSVFTAGRSERVCLRIKASYIAVLFRIDPTAFGSRINGLYLGSAKRFYAIFEDWSIERQNEYYVSWTYTIETD